MHEGFVNHRSLLTNGIHEIDPFMKFTVVGPNLFNVHRKIPRNMVRGYVTRSHTLLITVDSPFVAHVSGSHIYVVP